MRCQTARLYTPAHSQTTEELVAQALALGDSGETAVLDLLGVQLKRVLREFETLLDESSEFADATALLAKDLLGVRSTDDNLRRSEIRQPSRLKARHSLRCERG